MIAVIQRVTEAEVTIESTLKARIQNGLMILLGIGHGDNEEDADWLCKKIIHMRILGDKENKMNLSLKNTDGELLVVSQFTLYANTKKGSRPSFTDAASPEIAVALYEKFILFCQAELGKEIKTGKFGADMKVHLTNDGPVTIILDSKNRK
jgi:D-tyrosyl-tRNA(Tyr) deacylase